MKGRLSILGPMIAAVGVMVLSPWAFPAQASSHAVLNPIQIENAKTGTTNWELQSPAYGDQIEGYPSTESVYPGQTITFYVSTTSKLFKAQIYRIGWYGGTGGRFVDELSHLQGHAYSKPKPQSGTGLVACDWPAAFAITVPEDWTSGFYLVKLTARSDGEQSYIPFIVKESSPSRSPLIMLDEIGTSEAYNWWGGTSLFTNLKYSSSSQQFAHRAVEVSFLRPFGQNFGAGWFFSWEIHTVRWLEKNGYDVSYASELDVNDDPSILLNRKGIIIAGHDEYWSLGMRDGVQNAVNQGVSLANLAANTGYWQSRIEPLGSDPEAIEVCYKDFKRDPIHKTHPSLATVTWRSAQVNRPESELTGAMYGDFQGNNGPYPWVPTKLSSWIFQGTGLKRGDSIKGMVGHEDDTIIKGYPRPAGVQVLSASPIRNSVGERRVANSTIYRAASGAWVFDASSIDWGWGLDDIRQPGWFYEPDRKTPSPQIERITANILNAFLTNSG